MQILSAKIEERPGGLYVRRYGDPAVYPPQCIFAYGNNVITLEATTEDLELIGQCIIDIARGGRFSTGN